MAFTVEDFEDLLKLLGEHPEWQARLRPLILGEEILAVPSRMDRVEAAIERLTQRMDALTERVDALAERVDALTGDIRELTGAVMRLAARADQSEGHLGNLRGDMLEWKFERNLGNWLRDWVRKPRKVFTDDLDKLDEAIVDGRIADAEVVQLAWSDAVVRGLDVTTREEVVLAVEVSTTINVDDVERSTFRSTVLKRAGYDGRSFVVGNTVTDQARNLAAATGTTIVLMRLDP